MNWSEMSGYDQVLVLLSAFGFFASAVALLIAWRISRPVDDETDPASTAAE